MTSTSLVEITQAEQKISGRVDQSVTNKLTVSGASGGVGFRTATEAMEFAKLMSLSHIAIPKHLRGNPGACLAITIQAVEWRMSPYAVANKSYSVNDRLAYESQLIQAVILQRAPIKGRLRFSFSGSGASRRCKVEVTTSDGETVGYETPEIKDIQVKNSPLWKSDPDQQLSYTAGRALCRRHFPDVLLGVYAGEEINDVPREQAATRVVYQATSTVQTLDDFAAQASSELDHDPETGEVAGPQPSAGNEHAHSTPESLDIPDELKRYADGEK